jgi:hypothetical protein
MFNNLLAPAPEAKQPAVPPQVAQGPDGSDTDIFD